MAIRCFVALIMAVATARAATTPLPAEEQSASSGSKEQLSLLATMLTTNGFSDVCVAATLDICSIGQASLGEVQASSTPLPGEEHASPGLTDQHSVLSAMLVMTGHSHACVATALDICKAGQVDSLDASLTEEAREVVQQVSATIAKWDSQLSAALNKSESDLSAFINKSESFIDKSESFIDKSEFFINTSESFINASESFINTSEPELNAFMNTSTSLPRHCRDLQVYYGDTGRGPRWVYPDPTRPLHSVTVLCDHTVDGGGWTVFQRRTNDTQRQDFRRTWREYEDGFGDINGEYWLGLKAVHQLTSTGLHQLRIDLHDYEGEHRWAKYGYFTVLGPEIHYALVAGNYSGDAGDSLRHHSGQAFSTHDADHDSNSYNCAAMYSKGGWWYGDVSCVYSNLNGYQHIGSDSPWGIGITWYHWRGREYSLQATTMMTKPA